MLGRISISRKIGGSFAILLLFFVAFGALSWFALGAIERNAATMLGASGKSQLGTEVQRDVVTLDLRATEYVVLHQPENAKAFTDAEQALDHMLAAAGRSADMAAQVAAMRKQVAAYAAGFAKLKAAREQQIDLQDKIGQHLDAMARVISQILNWTVAANRAGSVVTVTGINQPVWRLRQAIADVVGSLRPDSGDDLRSAQVQLSMAIMGMDDVGKTVANTADLVPQAKTEATALAPLVRNMAASYDGMIHERGAIASGPAKALSAAAAALAAAGHRDGTAAAATLSATVGRVRAALVTALIAALVVGLVLAVLIGRDISGSVGAITAVLQRLAAGDTGVSIPGGERRDEIGRIAAAAEIFRSTAEEKQRLDGERQAMEQRTVAERRAQALALADRFEETVRTVVNRLSSSASSLRNAAGSMAVSAEEASDRAGLAAQRSQQVSANVQSVAGATEELTASIREIRERSGRSRTISTEAVREASAAEETVRALTDITRQIDDIVHLIGGIAGQTNLLALNATIEAARAGEAGRGFAVVAGEVKALSGQTARATEDITKRIESLRESGSRVAEAIATITHTINDLSSIAESVAGAVDEQGAATQEIARNVGETSLFTAEVSSDAETARRQAEATGNAAHGLVDAADAVARDSRALDAEVQAFLDHLRAA